jgi:hypothetical protein
MNDTDKTESSPNGEMDGVITFYEFFEPPLESGDYDVTVDQQTASADANNPFNETFETKISFGVQGARFTIPPTYLHTQFPPPDVQGEYSSVLAHLVFNVHTLPWQRDPRAPRPGEVEAPADDPQYSWLALLTFDVNDPVPELHSGTIAAFQPQNLPAGTVSYPNIGLEYGEQWTDPCEYIDVPGTLFAAIAPTFDDLRWLAHARTIDQTLALRKSEKLSLLPAQEFSVVISNRLPTPGNKAVCYLVSLESMADYLPTRNSPAANPPASIRLAVLSSWSFGAVNEPETFLDYFKNLNTDNPNIWTPQIPYANGAGEPNQVVQEALEMGYTAINHHTRQGADTVSWYRGPLLPYENPLYVTVPINSPDALARYAPDTGMFDVSLAAAWQLGQLLALNDSEFATLLYNWKWSQTQQAVASLETTFLAEQMGIDAGLISAPGQPVHVQLMSEVIKPLLQSLLRKGSEG